MLLAMVPGPQHWMGRCTCPCVPFQFPISAKIDYTGLTIVFKKEKFTMTENNISEAPKENQSARGNEEAT